MISGVDLAYTGGKAYEFARIDGDELNSVKFRHAFKNVGALIMRTQLGQAQRAILLQSMCRDDYAMDPAHCPGRGGNQNDLFTISQSASSTYRTTRLLEQMAHYSIGRGKILNERTQPQKIHNTTNLYGEQYLWDALHSSVWSVGLNLPGQLTKQGFLYICCPPDLAPSSHDAITKELADGAFKKTTTANGEMIILLNSDVKLKTAPIPQLEISIDTEYQTKGHKNCFIISYNDVKAQIGWMIHCGITGNKLVGPQYTEDLLRVVRIAKGHTHALSKVEYSLLIEQMRGKTTDVRFTQNRTLNLLDDVIPVLEHEYQFDPMKLITVPINTSYKLVQDRMKETDIVEDFLTGLLISEMVQVLKITEAKSTRPQLPREFTNSFAITLNNAKAFAYAYDLKNIDGSPAFFQTDDVLLSGPEGEMVDKQLHGDLQDPMLNNAKHTASLLATGMLIAEQMMLEQLLRDACVHGDEHPNARALQELLNDQGTYATLKKLAKLLPKDEQGPTLGLQINSCEAIVEKLRKRLGFDLLSEMAYALYLQQQPVEINYDADRALTNLFNVGKTLQKLEGISVAKQGSRGLNAGIVPVIKKLSPGLYSALMNKELICCPKNKLEKQNEKKMWASESQAIRMEKEANTEIDSDQDQEQVGSPVSANLNANLNANSNLDKNMCPYLMGLNTNKKEIASNIKEKENSIHFADKPNPPKQSTWCNFFTKKVLPAATVGLVFAGTAISYVNRMK